MAPILIVGSNSWAAVAEADTYFDEKYGASAWASLTAENKARLLIHAFNWIQQQSAFSIPTTSTAIKVKQAQFEIAWFIYNFFEEYEKRRALSAGGVTAFKILDFSESLKGVDFPLFIKDLLDDYLVSFGGGFPKIARELSQNAGE